MKICIDAGHNCPPRDTGAIGYLNEEQVAAAVAIELFKQLDINHTVLLTRPTDGSSVTNSLSQRCRQANDFNPDLFISIHCNAHKSTSQPMGTEVYAASNAGNQFAERVESAIAALGFKSRGVKNGANLFVIKYTQAPAILIELFFVDSEADCKLYEQIGAVKTAQTIADAINNRSTPEPIISTKIRDGYLKDAAHYDSGLAHQVQAWNWLQSKLSEADLVEFQRKFNPPTPIGKAAIESTPPSFNSAKIDWSNPDCKISKYFSVLEATKGELARTPHPASTEAANIIKLAAELDKLREAFGSAIGVTSWNRPPVINEAVGGVENSQHITGGAADIYPLNGMDIYEFQKWCDARWYGGLGYGAKKGFVHLDMRNGKGFMSTGPKGDRWNY